MAGQTVGPAFLGERSRMGPPENVSACPSLASWLGKRTQCLGTWHLPLRNDTV